MIDQGWVCPKCGGVWAPCVLGCVSCNHGHVRLLPRKSARHRPASRVNGSSLRSALIEALKDHPGGLSGIEIDVITRNQRPGTGENSVLSTLSRLKNERLIFKGEDRKWRLNLDHADIIEAGEHLK